ncbi:efflux RND transporter permease subunit [Ectobacillus panaciterrae]|uniref:efflux RND transporter permease subunit n=1 Tax=Ectobacillus panaciterrae TaxID=363872 RepID=UPI00040CB3B2|nr:efflux RND transporter permease subunit [Ectobacillus panaciterrae]
MKIANFSIRRPVTILMMMVALLIVGAISVPLLPVDLYPNMNIPTVMIATSWNGASPGEVESQVTKKVEGAVATVAGVSQVSSTSQTGQSVVSVQFSYKTNLDQAVLALRDKLDRIRKSLPSDADTPTVVRADPNSQPILSLAIYGNLDPIALRSIADNTVSPAIQRTDGVASVNVSGGRVRQIQVLVDPNKLTEYGLSINSVVSALGNDNTSLDAGMVNKGSQLVPLHLNGDFRNVSDIQQVQIPVGKGSTIPLSQIAQINDSYQDVTVLTRKDGMQSVGISILKQSDSNTVSVATNVQQEVSKLQSTLPKGVHISVLSDQSQYIRDSIQTVVEHTLLGAAISILVLIFFLRSIRATFVIGVVIPIAIISTFSLMYFANQSINTITLGGLALGLGSLVDFAVVVLESIYRKRSEGYDAVEGAKRGTAEVGTAVIASALAQISVFGTAVFTTGMAQQIFLPMALVVVFSHIAALFAAVTLVPMLSSKWLKGNIEENTQGHPMNPVIWFQKGMNRLYKGYGTLLHWALHHRIIVVFCTILLFAGSIMLVPLVGSELMPSSDQGQLRVNINLTQGTNLDQTNKIASNAEELVRKIPEVATIYTTVGSGGGSSYQSNGTNTASLQVTLKPTSQRTKSTDNIVEEIRNELGSFPGAKVTVNTVSQAFGKMGGGNGGSGGGDVEVDVTGPDLHVLQQLGDLVARDMNRVKGVRNAVSSLDRSAPEYQLTIDRVAAAHYGVAVKDILTSLRTAYQGAIATGFNTADSQVDVVVKYPESFSNELANLKNVVITSSNGTQVPLSEVSSIQLTSSPAKIQRQNQQRTVAVQASVFGVDAGTVTKQVQQQVSQIQAPDGYHIVMGGQQKDMNQSFQNLGLMLGLSVLLVYMVMAGLFESLYAPFVIMFSLPPTFVGAVIGLAVTHRTINMNSIIGMIMLMGIVVNNAIVLIDYTNQLRKQGYSLQDALLQAGPIRLRPILMTTGITVLAMLPLVIGLGAGAETQASMATVVAFGLTFSTLVTLVLVPVVYTIFDQWISKFKMRFRPKFKQNNQVNM